LTYYTATKNSFTLLEITIGQEKMHGRCVQHSTFLKESFKFFVTSLLFMYPVICQRKKNKYMSVVVDPVSEHAGLVYPNAKWFSRYGSGFLTRIQPFWHKKAVIRDVSRSWFLSIPDLGSRIQQHQQKEEGENIWCPTFFVATNITKLNIILILKWKRKKFEPICKEL
jgi:hypothetical protein